MDAVCGDDLPERWLFGEHSMLRPEHNPLTTLIQATVPDTDESLDRAMALACDKHRASQ